MSTSADTAVGLLTATDAFSEAPRARLAGATEAEVEKVGARFGAAIEAMFRSTWGAAPDGAATVPVGLAPLGPVATETGDCRVAAASSVTEKDVAAGFELNSVFQPGA